MNKKTIDFIREALEKPNLAASKKMMLAYQDDVYHIVYEDQAGIGRCFCEIAVPSSIIVSFDKKMVGLYCQRCLKRFSEDLRLVKANVSPVSLLEVCCSLANFADGGELVYRVRDGFQMNRFSLFILFLATYSDKVFLRRAINYKIRPKVKPFTRRNK